MPESERINLRFTGDYSLTESVTLAASAAFVEPLRVLENRAVLDLAFALEGSWNTVGVRVEQQGGKVHAQVLANPGAATTADVCAQLERMLCLDVDGAGFASVAARDAVVAGLAARHPGLRPVLFPSLYEAAARAIIGQGLPVRQAAVVSARIAKAYGVHVTIGERSMHAFPAPDRLAELKPVAGMAGRKVEHLRTLGAAAVDGRFSSSQLRAVGRDEALERLQTLPGIGPFSAELILLRGVGDSDAFPQTELRLHRAMASAYQLGDTPNLATLERIAEGWRPYRSWVGLLLRNF